MALKINHRNSVAQSSGFQIFNVLLLLIYLQINTISHDIKLSEMNRI